MSRSVQLSGCQRVRKRIRWHNEFPQIIAETPAQLILNLKFILLTRVARSACVHSTRWFPLISLVLSQSVTLHGQPSAINHVLELDGKGSYIQLPPGIFKELTESTVEGWVKWDSFRRWSRLFDFGP